MQRLVQRATLILMAFAGAHNKQIVTEVFEFDVYDKDDTEGTDGNMRKQR